MRKLTLALSATAAAAVAGPALAADLTVSVEIPRLSVAAYHRPYVAVWIERPDNTAVRTMAVWFWFIDVFAVACIVFAVTGFGLTWLHARQRPSTWPLLGLGLLIPVVIALIFIH